MYQKQSYHILPGHEKNHLNGGLILMQNPANESAIEIIIIDVEEYAKKGELPPKGMRYRIRVDKEYYVVDVPEVTGRDILLLAGKTPPERFRLDEKLKGGATKKIELTDIVDLTTHGVERFMTLPLDQTEGEQ
ncbi:multiubiquitin domain-containing protein [Alicyclobacillus ferrooxydans]|nr:multiubiquitin domain-containing protein [Alicyclobacillus ferrooxydans]